MKDEFLLENCVILYEDEHFAVGFGFDSVNQCANRVGLRWTGKNEGNAFPKGSGGQPRWLFLPEQFADSFLRSLLYKKGANDDEIIKAIKRL